MAKTRLNPGRGVQSQHGYGPKLSRRGIDKVYSQASQGEGNTPLQSGGCSGPYGTPGNKQCGGLTLRDVIDTAEKYGPAALKTINTIRSKKSKSTPTQQIEKISQGIAPVANHLVPIIGRPIKTTTQTATKGPAQATYDPWLQTGGLSLKDVGHGLKVAWDWAKKNKPLEKINNILDSVVPASAKGNPIYSNIRNVTGAVSKQLGIGQTGQIMGEITYNKGQLQPVLAPGLRRLTTRPHPKRTPQKGSGRKKQAGTGRKRKSRK